jgi:hypothetical protein
VDDGRNDPVESTLEVVVSDAAVTAEALGLEREAEDLAPLVAFVTPTSGARLGASARVRVALAAFTANGAGSSATFDFAGRTAFGRNQGDLGAVELYVDGTRVAAGEAEPGARLAEVDLGEVDLSGIAAGAHVLTAVAYQGSAQDGLGRAARIWVWADRVGPRVRILSPVDGAAAGAEVLVRGTADDEAGVAGVWVNGEAAVDTSPEGDWSTWQAPVAVDGAGVTITVAAEDLLGNRADPAAQVTVRAGGVSLFGEPLDGEVGSLIYVLDRSGSMRWPVPAYRDVHGLLVEGASRLERAVAAVTRSVEDLPPETLFNVVAYETCAVAVWPTRRAASAENKAEALAWLAGLGGAGQTSTAVGVSAALAERENRRVLLISDGYPNTLDCDALFRGTPTTTGG